MSVDILTWINMNPVRNETEKIKMNIKILLSENKYKVLTCFKQDVSYF